jgi:hypothetical protein
MSLSVLGFLVYLAPMRRGAPDTLSHAIANLFKTPASQILIASQQVSRRDFVEAAYNALSQGKGRGRVLIESDYLHERSWPETVSVFSEDGKYEENRRCFAALMRGGFRVQADTVSSALQHANFIITTSENQEIKSFLTSANLSEGSLRSHFNWGLMTANTVVADALSVVFQQAWDGDFRDANAQLVLEEDDGTVELSAGADGQALEQLDRTFANAKEDITFAFFNISSSSSLIEAFVHAVQRGVRVTGIVDGDQGLLPWDAVPILRASGVDVRYYPGALTGGNGRMHYKMAAVDGETAYMTTANISQNAMKSLEMAVTFQGVSQLSTFLRSEITRLSAQARTLPPPLNPFN